MCAATPRCHRAGGCVGTVRSCTEPRGIESRTSSTDSGVSCVQALHSPIGQSDGEAYKHLYNAVVSAPGALSRPDWWREYVAKPTSKGDGSSSSV